MTKAKINIETAEFTPHVWNAHRTDWDTAHAIAHALRDANAEDPQAKRLSFDAFQASASAGFRFVVRVSDSRGRLVAWLESTE